MRQTIAGLAVLMMLVSGALLDPTRAAAQGSCSEFISAGGYYAELAFSIKTETKVMRIDVFPYNHIWWETVTTEIGYYSATSGGVTIIECSDELI